MADQSRHRQREAGRHRAETGASPPDVRTASAAAPTIWDVWSRPSSKYRIRAVVLLLVNVLLFAGLGIFAFWLRTGLLFAPRIQNYWGEFWRTFHPAGEDRVTLSHLLTFPISIYDVPLQIVVLGLLLAALVSIPILVSILYRFVACIPFLLVVAFLAMMPWLAITLAGSCLLASVKPFRFSFRYASALLGLLLVVIYFFSASRQSATAVQFMDNPADRIKFVAPWVLAVIASCAVCGVVLVIAKAVNYRPGAIAPLLATMFAAPVLLFEFHVGRDELQYRLLEHRFGPGSSYFADQDVSDDYEKALARWHKLRESPKPTYEALDAQLDLQWQLLLDDVIGGSRTLFDRHRDAAVRACDTFLYRYPLSRYAANALYIQATARDTRIDLSAFRTDKLVRFYNTFPAAASRRSWEKLVTLEAEAPSPLSAVGLLRLAQLDAREREVGRAIERLKTLIDTFAGIDRTMTQPAAGPIRVTFARKHPAASLKVPLEPTVFEARRFLAMLLANGLPPGGDPLYGFDPLCGGEPRRPGDAPFGLLQLDPRDVGFSRNLKALLARYSDALLADNVELELAKATQDVDAQTHMLEACVGRWQHEDALPEALYWLGEAYLKAERPADARRPFERILADYPESVWKPQAEMRLRNLPVTSEIIR